MGLPLLVVSALLLTGVLILKSGFYYSAGVTNTTNPPNTNSDVTPVVKENCVDADKYCSAKSDGSTCNYGVWCDEERRKCGGQSCVGLDVAVCTAGKCVNSHKTPELQDLIIPDLPNAKWITKTSSENVGLSCLGGNICTKDGSQLSLPGKSYTYTRSFNTNEEREKDTFSLLLFSTKLEELGWKDFINTGEYTLSIGHGDGPFSSTGGVLAYKGSKIRAVITRVSSAESGSYPNIVCPCQIIDDVFVSDEVDIKNTILQQSK